jgi:predicted RNA-binding protein with TRAM domain
MRRRAFLQLASLAAFPPVVAPRGVERQEASRLKEIESLARRKFFLVPKENTHLDHFLVLEQGKVETIAPEAPFAEGATVEVQPVEVGLHDSHAAVAKLDGYDIVVADAAKQVGKKVKATIERIQPGIAYATIAKAGKAAEGPITAEREAERPTRASKASPKDGGAEADLDVLVVVEEVAEDVDELEDEPAGFVLGNQRSLNAVMITIGPGTRDAFEPEPGDQR